MTLIHLGQGTKIDGTAGGCDHFGLVIGVALQTTILCLVSMKAQSSVFRGGHGGMTTQTVVAGRCQLGSRR